MNAPSPRPQGTVYGRAPGRPAPPHVAPAHVAPAHVAQAYALDQSGSLTGQILSQGRPAELPREQQRNRTLKTAFLMGTMLGAIVIIGVVAAYLAGDYIRTLTDG